MATPTGPVGSSQAPPADEGGPPGPARPRLPIVPALVLLAVIGGLVGLVVARSSPSQQLRRLIDRQIKLVSGGKYGQLHATLSAQSKKACPRTEFVGKLVQQVASEGDFWSLVDYRDIRIEVHGDRALVTYVITYNGAVVERATAQDPDVYVRATKTVLGPKPNVAEQLAALARQQAPGPLANPLPPKEYEAARQRIIKTGSTRPDFYRAGQWYDEMDGHTHCGS
jgi:hypothetical protein